MATSKMTKKTLCERMCWLEEQHTRQKAEIAELKRRNEELEARNDELEERNDEIIDSLTEDQVGELIETDKQKDAPTSVNLEERGDSHLYWGVNDGHLTIWRFPRKLDEELMEEGEEECDLGLIYGNWRCLGEEWGTLSSAIVRTITMEMLKAEDFDN